MPLPQTVNGRVYTTGDFSPYNYTQGLPDLAGDMVAEAARAVDAAASTQALFAALQSRRYPIAAISGAASLSLAEHNGRLLLVTGSGTITVPWSATGEGWSCLVLNLRTTPLPIAASGATLRHPDGHARIRPGGLAALLGYAEGVAGNVHISGQTEA